MNLLLSIPEKIQSLEHFVHQLETNPKKSLTQTALEALCSLRTLWIDNRSDLQKPEIKKETICSLCEVTLNIYLASQNCGRKVARTRGRVRKEIRRIIAELLPNIKSQELQPKAFICKLIKLPPCLPAFDLLRGHKKTPEPLRLLNLAILKLSLNIKSEEVLERCFINAKLVTALDLMELCQLNAKSKRNVMQIIKERLDDSRTQARRQMTVHDCKAFDLQWSAVGFSNHVSEAWDFLRFRMFEQELKKINKGEEILQRMMLYQSPMKDYIFVIYLKSFTEATLFRSKTHKDNTLRLYTWESLWSKDAKIFYIHTCYRSVPIQPSSYITAMDIRKKRCLGYYEQVDFDSMKKFYEKFLNQETSVEAHTPLEEPSIWGFRRVGTLQDLALSVLFPRI